LSSPGQARHLRHHRGRPAQRLLAARHQRRGTAVQGSPPGLRRAHLPPPMTALIDSPHRMVVPLGNPARPRPVTVLVIDAEPAVLRLVRFLLVSSGYACLEARHADEAMQAAASGPRIDVLLVDIDLPGRAALTEGLRELSPGARVLFMRSSSHDPT